MKKTIAIMLLAAATAAVCTEEASAQARRRPSGPSMRRSRKPVTSPYLNLLNQGDINRGGVGFQYFQRVQPEIEFRQSDNLMRNSIDNLQQQVNDQQLLLDQATSSQLTPTGHTTQFFSFGNYFPGGQR